MTNFCMIFDQTISSHNSDNTYNDDNDEYYDFMYSEIWNVKLEEEKYEGCLVVVSGFTTETVLEERSEVIRNCVLVDEVVIGAPPATDKKFMELHRIDTVVASTRSVAVIVPAA